MSDVMYVSHLANRGVMNDSGEVLGKIKAIGVNIDSGQVAYAVLATGAFPKRTKLLAVPWELLRFSSHDKRFILNVPRKTVKTAAGYGALDELATAPNFYWLGDVYEYYSDKPDWEHKRQEQMQRDIAAAQARRQEILKPQE